MRSRKGSSFARRCLAICSLPPRSPSVLMGAVEAGTGRTWRVVVGLAAGVHGAPDHLLGGQHLVAVAGLEGALEAAARVGQLLPEGPQPRQAPGARLREGLVLLDVVRRALLEEELQVRVPRDVVRGAADERRVHVGVVGPHRAGHQLRPVPRALGHLEPRERLPQRADRRVQRAARVLVPHVRDGVLHAVLGQVLAEDPLELRAAVGVQLPGQAGAGHDPLEGRQRDGGRLHAHGLGPELPREDVLHRPGCTGTPPRAWRCSR